jgi:hypothetical protein
VRLTPAAATVQAGTALGTACGLAALSLRCINLSLTHAVLCMCRRGRGRGRGRPPLSGRGGPASSSDLHPDSYFLKPQRSVGSGPVYREDSGEDEEEFLSEEEEPPPGGS